MSPSGRSSRQHNSTVGAFAAVAGDAILRRLVVAVLIFAIATQMFPVIWPFYTVEAFGFTPILTGVS